MVRAAWSVMFEVGFVSSCEYVVKYQGRVFARVLAELALRGGSDYWCVSYQDARVMPFDTAMDAIASAVKRKCQTEGLTLATPRTPLPANETTDEYTAHSPHCPHCIVAAAERS